MGVIIKNKINYTGGGGNSMHIYSTTERVVGTWIDGKPLYEKTFNTTVTIAIKNQWYNADDLSDLNIENLVSFESRNGNTNLIQVTTWICAYLNGTTLQVTSPEPWAMSNYTIRYTKTTD